MFGNLYLHLIFKEISMVYERLEDVFSFQIAASYIHSPFIILLLYQSFYINYENFEIIDRCFDLSFSPSVWVIILELKLMSICIFISFLSSFCCTCNDFLHEFWPEQYKIFTSSTIQVMLN